MENDDFADYLALHQALASVSDAFGLPVDKAAIYLGRSESQLNKLRLRDGAGPGYYKDRGGQVFYPLGELRRWHRDTAKPLLRSTADVVGAFTNTALGRHLGQRFSFWQEKASGVLLGPVYGPYNPDPAKALMDPTTEVARLTPVEALLRPWKNEEARAQAKGLVIARLQAA